MWLSCCMIFDSIRHGKECMLLRIMLMRNLSCRRWFPSPVSSNDWNSFIFLVPTKWHTLRHVFLIRVWACIYGRYHLVRVLKERCCIVSRMDRCSFKECFDQSGRITWHVLLRHIRVQRTSEFNARGVLRRIKQKELLSNLAGNGKERLLMTLVWATQTS